ncbi:radical SAM/SPASM domain protein, ACGX system [uncultured Alistipes sp.]|jgi:radical SAM domain protein|uniref:radical SAM/SPASM domain protein, ACGX system n=1 Tax=uncultured Alistipes sp. TaxID=538949 RepID=UPI0025E8F387|nr:radical SAM/SPASM domain protein, ACGX system [uncultured Alistipes sp.]
MTRKFANYFGLQLHITDDCDQRCEHCYIFNDPLFQGHNLSLVDIKSIIVNFESFCESMEYNPHISLTGGDPLLRKDIWEILGYIHQRKIPYSILGNPFHLTQTVANRLFSLGCEKYQLSIDGLEKTHDEIRKKGSFAATLDALEVLNKSGVMSQVMMTISKKNYMETPDVVRFLEKKSVCSFAFARYCPTSMDKNLDHISPQEYKEFLSIMWNVYQELAHGRTEFFLKDHLWTLFLYEKGLFQLQEEDIIYEGCGCAIHHMTVLPNGEVYACRRFNSSVGNALTKSFKEIFFGNEIEQYRDYEKMECYSCELFNYCRGCPAVSYGTYGSFYKKDPQCWI